MEEKVDMSRTDEACAESVLLYLEQYPERREAQLEELARLIAEVRGEGYWRAMSDVALFAGLSRQTLHQLAEAMDQVHDAVKSPTAP